MTMRISPAGLSFLALTLSASSPGASAPSSVAVSRASLDLTPVPLRGNVHPAIASGKVLSTVDRSVPMEKMILVLRSSPEAQQRLQALLKDQQNPKSSSYHRWLTPQQFGEQFGPSAQDVAKLTGWLQGQGFRIEQVTPGRNAIVFSGSAGAVMDAFRTTLARVDVNGVVRQGNLTDPSIPAAFTGLVHGVVSLHNIPRKAMNRGAKVLEPTPIGNAHMVNPHYTSQSGNTYLAPGDFAAIYNTNNLIANGIDGTGMTIAIAGRTDILRSDVEGFRHYYGLPPHKLAMTYNGPNPGIVDANDETEADLDVQWSGAVAPNATVEFVCTGSTNTADGVDLSILYIVNNNIAPVASVSFGIGELIVGQAGTAFFDAVFAQAAAQGQTFFVSSGDSGAAGDFNWDGYAKQADVNAIGSSPNCVCVGGTQFDGDVSNPAAYWSPTNFANKSSALGYIPETTWNESDFNSGQPWATGGGYSNFFLQPSWQGDLVPGATYRAVPDVSLTAASHDGYLVAQEGYLEIVSGTSAASPSFAGLMALVVQATGQRQGNANPVLYQLGTSQYNAEGPAIFHDVTTGDNIAPYSSFGYYAAPGYDACTGLGSVDAAALVTNWISDPNYKNAVTAQITSPAAATLAFSGSGTQAFTATGSDSNPNEILTYTWTFGDGTFATGQSVSHTFTTGAYTINYPVTLTVTDSTGNLAADTRMVRVSSPNLSHAGTPIMLDLLQWSIDLSKQDLSGDLNGDGLIDDNDLKILLGAL